MANLREVNGEELADEIKSGKRILVDFFSSTCGPCKMLSFILEDVAKSLSNNVEILKVDFNKNKEQMPLYGVNTFPIMILFEEGKEKKRIIGLQQKPIIMKAIEE